MYGKMYTNLLVWGIKDMNFVSSHERTAKETDQFARTLLEKEIKSGYKLSGIVKE